MVLIKDSPVVGLLVSTVSDAAVAAFTTTSKGDPYLQKMQRNLVRVGHEPHDAPPRALSAQCTAPHPELTALWVCYVRVPCMSLQEWGLGKGCTATVSGLMGKKFKGSMKPPADLVCDKAQTLGDSIGDTPMTLLLPTVESLLVVYVEDMMAQLQKLVFDPIVSQVMSAVHAAMGDLGHLITGLCGGIPFAGGAVCMSIVSPIWAVVHSLVPTTVPIT